MVTISCLLRLADAVKHVQLICCLFLDDCRLEELKVQLPSPESSSFKLCAIDFEKVQSFFPYLHFSLITSIGLLVLNATSTCANCSPLVCDCFMC